jgi:hypothetical protein
MTIFGGQALGPSAEPVGGNTLSAVRLLANGAG